MNSLNLKNARIVCENQIIENGYLKIKNGKIVEIGSGDINDALDLQKQWVLPGFIDCHVHGGYGVDFETGDENRFAWFSEKVVQEGITSYVQASVANATSDLEKYLEQFNHFLTNPKFSGAKCVGLHLEGPFISPMKKGAHDENILLKPDAQLVAKWNEMINNKIKIISYAPELQDGKFTEYLVENNIIASAGHSVVSACDFKRDYDLGIRHTTHLFNAMSGVDHKNPGLAVAGLINKGVLVEVISDGIHLAKEILQLIYQTKTADEIVIITDAMNAKGQKDGEYKLGHLDVTKVGMKAVLQGTDTLAGSCASYDHNVRVFQKTCNIDMLELIKMTSINIAKQLNIFDEVGSIAENKFGDLVILDSDLNVQKTIVNGNIVFEKN